MTKLLTKNSKISKSNNDQYTVYNFGIPAYKARSGLMTCPMAGVCTNGCYAQAGAYRWSNVAQAYENRLTATLQSDFSDLLQTELNPKIKTALRQGKQLVIRIHDSGDFYNIEYLEKWLTVMKNNPNVMFYAYTKMIPVIKSYIRQKKIPNNFTIIMSEGGLSDNLINPKIHRHSRVFDSEQALIEAGYDNASKDDTVAFLSTSGRIGLVFHGPKSKAFKTA